MKSGGPEPPPPGGLATAYTINQGLSNIYTKYMYSITSFTLYILPKNTYYSSNHI